MKLSQKEEIVETIKKLARDLDARAEDIANDYNKRIRSIEIHANIEVGYVPEWDITKHYGLLTDEMLKQIEDIINNPNDAPKSIKAQASLQAPIKNEKKIADEIGKAVKESLNQINIKLPDLESPPKVEIPNYIGDVLDKDFLGRDCFGNVIKSGYRNGGDG